MSTFRSVKPAPGEYAPYYDKYIAQVPAGDIVTTLANQQIDMVKFFADISDEQAMLRYAPEKWTIKQVLGHITDTERVFAYRALSFARNTQTALPGMEQNQFTEFGGHSDRPWANLISECDHLRASTLDLFGSFDEAAWLRHGVASNNDVSVRALAWISAGHAAHHIMIIKERYLGKGRG